MAPKDAKELSKYKLANDEFRPLLRQIYKKNIENDGTDEHLPINVDPEKIICLRRAIGGGKKYAYIRPIKNEYQLLTEARYFLVVCDEQFNGLSKDRQVYTICHEYAHCWFDLEKQTYEVRSHDIENFSFMLRDAEWKTELAKGYKYEQTNLFTDSPKEKVLAKEAE